MSLIPLFELPTVPAIQQPLRTANNTCLSAAQQSLAALPTVSATCSPRTSFIAHAPPALLIARSSDNLLNFQQRLPHDHDLTISSGLSTKHVACSSSNPCRGANNRSMAPGTPAVPTPTPSHYSGGGRRWFLIIRFPASWVRYKVFRLMERTVWSAGSIACHTTILM